MDSRIFPANGENHIKTIFQKCDLPEDAHAGLVFNKFLNIWEGDSSGPSKRKDIGQTLERFVKHYNNRSPKLSDPCRLLSEMHQRMKRLEEKRDIKTLACKVSWCLACGLGSPNPIGNGFDFDPVIGVPIINSTAVKGLCRYTAKIFSHDETEMTRLFGPETIEPGLSDPVSGEILFFDAFPAAWPRLRVDIINCHHSNYYTSIEKCDSRNNWPKETESPVPVFFLTVEKGTEFIFRISSRNLFRNGTQTENDIKAVSNFLRQGLEYFGIGAKTAVGYGVFNVPQ